MPTKKPQTKEVALRDRDGQAGPQIKVAVDFYEDAIFLRPEGYGDKHSVDGHGVPIMLEYFNGHLQLIVWPDINDENPTIISLEKAREDRREEGK